MSHFIICGTGRSGTTYCQAVLRVCGVNCSHQQVFTWANYTTRFWDWRDRDGDSSYMAVPLLDKITQYEPDTRIVLVKRNPLRVAWSWLGRGAFADDMDTALPDFASILNERFPDVLAADTPHDRAMRYVEAWNGYAEQYAHHVFDIESLVLPELFDAVGHLNRYDAVLAGAISETINTDRVSGG